MGDGLLHIDRLGMHRRTYVKCCVCGKEFPKTVDHAYKVVIKDVDYFSCSWSCQKIKRAEAEALKAARKVRKKAVKEPEEIDEIKAARSKIERCKYMIAKASKNCNDAEPGTNERKNAQKRMYDWRKKLTQAQEELRAAKRKDRGKTK